MKHAGIDDVLPWGFTPRQAFDALRQQSHIRRAYSSSRRRDELDQPCRLTACGRRWTFERDLCDRHRDARWAIKEIRKIGYYSLDEPAGVYRTYGQSGNLLYVGCSANPKERLASHRATSKWWGEHDPGLTKIVMFPTRWEALIEETRAINEECPIYNKQKNSTRLYHVLKHYRMENLRKVADLRDLRQQLGFDVPVPHPWGGYVD